MTEVPEWFERIVAKHLEMVGGVWLLQRTTLVAVVAPEHTRQIVHQLNSAPRGGWTHLMTRYEVES